MSAFRLFKITLLLALPFLNNTVDGQARGSIGFGAGVMKPVASGYSIGSTWVLQGNIKVAKKFAIVPALGLEKVKGDYSAERSGSFYTGRTRDVNLVMLSLSAKYYASNSLFVSLGPTIFAGGEDAGSSGIGGTTGVGCDLPVGPHGSFELLLHCDLINVYEVSVGVVGLRLAYKFNFRAPRSHTP